MNCLEALPGFQLAEIKVKVPPDGWLEESRRWRLSRGDSVEKKAMSDNPRKIILPRTTVGNYYRRGD